MAHDNIIIKQIPVRWIFLSGLLILSIAIIYGQTRSFGYIDYDDNVYIFENQNIQKELSLESLYWSLTASYESSWQPIVWISYLVEYQLYGLNPNWQHLVNVFFHIASTLMLLIFLKKMTGSFYKSLFVSVMFALHPIHVESVVWITERKDVLCAFFWMLTILSYIRYVSKPGRIRFLPVLLFLCMGLMTKPMPVTLPFTLLLLDFWPLGRMGQKKMKDTLILVREKLPLFIPVIISCVITVLVSKSGRALSSLEILPISVRIENVFFSYLSYLGKLFWPFNLSVFYPHPGAFPPWIVASAVTAILVVSFFSIRKRRTLPWLFTGWFWYLGTLIPVIGIVQIGGFAMADRFAYIPFIGIYVIIAWSIPCFFKHCKQQKIILAKMSICLFFIMMVITKNQVAYWQNSLTLYQHALNSTAKSAIAHNGLGVALKKAGAESSAMMHFSKALEIDSKFTLAHNNLGLMLAEKGDIEGAISHYMAAILVDSKFAEAHNNLGILYYQINQFQKAINHFEKALEIKPKNTDFQKNLNTLLQARNRIDMAIQKIETKLKNDPSDAMMYFQLGSMYKNKGENEIAAEQYQKALSIKPDLFFAEEALKTIKNQKF